MLIATVILLSFAVGLLLGLTALLMERYGATRSRRGLWIISLAASVAGTLRMFFSVESESGTWRHMGAPSVVPVQDPILLFCRRLFEHFAPALLWPQINSILLEIWIASCGATLAVLVYEWIGLKLLSRRWRLARVGDTTIWASEDFGPATFGLRTPRIVIPRWLLSADPLLRAVAFAHESEHIRKHDVFLSVSGTLLRATMPWNPVLDWQLKKLLFAIEVDCDRRVLDARILDRRSYVHALEQLWRRRYDRTTHSCIGALSWNDSDVRRRIKIISADSRPF